MRRNTIVALLFIILLGLASPAFALSFNNQVLGISTTDGFGLGLMPTKVNFEFAIPGMEIIEGNTTALTFDFCSGFAERINYVNPATGRFEYTDSSELLHFDREVKKYGVVYGHGNTRFTQGFYQNDANNRDLFKVWTQLDFNFEQACPTVADFRIDNNPFGASYTIENSSGKPDFVGNRSIFASIWSLGIDFPWSTGSYVTADGMTFGINYEVSLLEANRLFTSCDVPVDFRTFHAYYNWYKTLYQKKRESGMNLLSIVVSDKVSYRHTAGRYIPMMAIEGGIWQVGARNLENYAKNRFSFTFYGPQIYTSDTYVFAEFALDTHYGFGPQFNTDNLIKENEFAISTHLYFELRMINSFHLYWDLGQVIGRFGSGEGVRNGFFIDPFYLQNKIGFYISL